VTWMESFITSCLSSYVITLVLTKGSIFDSIRPKHKFFSCRMCVGCWVSLATVLVLSDITMWLPVYGASYFLATQERT
jgi:hypothetical protein